MARNIAKLPLEVLGFRQMTDTAVASPLLGIPSGATIVWLSAADQNHRIRLDGVDPTTTVGHVIPADTDGIWLNLVDLSKVRVIEVAANGELFITYFRPRATG